MPLLSNIQTYEKIEGSNFRPTLDRFCNVLKSIELWTDELQLAFDNFEWTIEDNGLVYASIFQIGHLSSKLSGVKIRPTVMVCSSCIDKTFKDHWIAFDLLIDEGELRSYNDGHFYSHTYPLIKSLTIEMNKEFMQTGIYFTDEYQDALDFDGIRSNDKEKLWQFDYALIPLTLEELYNTQSDTHDVKRHENYIEAWYVDRWKESPNR